MELDATLDALEIGLAVGVPLSFVACFAPPVRRRVRARRGLVAFASAALVALATLVYAKRIEPHAPVVTRTTIPLVGEPFRIVLLSDFHAGRLDATDLARVVATTNAEHPDLVVLAGDYISGYEMIAERERALGGLRGLAARHGVLAVMGNHDSEPYGDDAPRRAAIVSTLAGFGYRVLENEAIDVGPLVVVGLEDVQAGRTDAARATKGIARPAPRVFLAHDWHALPASPLDLALVGHTHGGQVCVPFTEWCGASARDRPFVRGRYPWPHGGALYVTRGVGLAKANVRLACAPEIAVLEVGGKR